MSDENIMRMWNDCSVGGNVRPRLKTTVKTASYTITAADFGTVFTTRGGSGVTFTLPAVQTIYDGEVIIFLNVADYDMTVDGTDGELVVFNNLTGNSLGFMTTSEKIGGAMLAICDGTSWIVLPLGTETQTISVDTSPSATVSSTPSATPSST